MKNDFFTILIDDTVEFTDISLQLKEYNTPAISLELTAADTLYIGYNKSFSSFFIELEDKALLPLEFTAEYYNGTVWTSLDLSDETSGFSKSGFIYFDKPEDMASVEVDGKSKFYIRLMPSIDTGVVTGKYLDILFSSDLDLCKIRENIVEKFALTGSWIKKHIQARDHIIREIANKGNTKEIIEDEGLVSETKLYKDITRFDFLNPLQFRLASSYLAMYFIFWFELSDEEGDKWEIKAKEMYRLYEQTIEVFLPAIDLNDDGVQGEDDYGSTGAVRTIVTGQ